MRNMLVCFTLYRDGELVDMQYHFFTKCNSRVSFIHDSIFRAFVGSKGYTWSAIDFPTELAEKCFFTMSDCEE